MSFLLRKCIVVYMPPRPDKREQRHTELLEVAREVLISMGLSGFSVEQVAKLSGYSRPTIYAHFGSKKAILDALAARNLEVGRGLMERAAKVGGTAREQAFALIFSYEVMARFHPQEFHLTELLGMPWVRVNLPKATAMAFSSMIEAYYDALHTQVEVAVSEGELELRPEMTTGNIVFHSLSMSYGIYTSIIKERIILRRSGSAEPWTEARTALQCYWDGIGWGGGRSQVEYDEFAEQLLKETFPELWLEAEMEKLKRESGIGAGSGMDAGQMAE